MTDRDDLPRLDAALPDAPLLEGLLGEAAGLESPPDVSETVARRLDAPPPSNAGTLWITAAVVLLGLGALTWIALATGAAPPSPVDDPDAVEAPQDPLPDPLPSAFRVTSLTDAPADARNLRLDVVGTGDGWFEGLDQLPRLERLEVRGARRGPVDRRNRGARTIDAEALTPLANCTTLHSLVFWDLHGVSAEQIRSLAAVPGLRSLELHASNLELDPALAAAVCELPQLHDLRLRTLRVTSEGLAGLAEAPALRGLELHGAAGLEADGLAAVAALRDLRHLALTRVDSAKNMMSGNGLPTSFDLLDPDYLATLPALESLDLSDNLIFPKRAAALPKSLRHLSLASCAGLENGIEGFAEALLALPQLESLEFHTSSPPSEFLRLAKPGATVTDPEAVILEAVLGGRQLERLAVRRVPTGAWREALAGQSLLRTLHISSRPRRGEGDPQLDLGFAAHLANLEILTLDVLSGQTAQQIAAIDFAPLAALPRLRLVVLPGWRPGQCKRAREALGDRIEVRD